MKKYLCPVCGKELQYKLYVEPVKTKSLRCTSCGTRVSVPMEKWVPNMP